MLNPEGDQKASLDEVEESRGKQSLPLLMKAEKANIWISGILAARLEHVIWLSQQDVAYTSNQGPEYKDGGVVENLLWTERQQELQ